MDKENGDKERGDKGAALSNEPSGLLDAASLFGELRSAFGLGSFRSACRL